MFGSRSIVVHLIRGAIGVCAVAAAVFWHDIYWWLPGASIVVALVAFGGCPMCWIVGLVSTRASCRVEPRTTGATPENTA